MGNTRRAHRTSYSVISDSRSSTAGTHPRDAGVNKGAAARRRTAEVIAWLERHVCRRALGRAACARLEGNIGGWLLTRRGLCP